MRLPVCGVGGIGPKESTADGYSSPAEACDCSPTPESVAIENSLLAGCELDPKAKMGGDGNGCLLAPA